MNDFVDKERDQMRLLVISFALAGLILAQALPAHAAEARVPAVTTDRVATDDHGRVDLDEWQLTSNVARGQAPRFAPVKTSGANAIPTDGSWSALGSNGSGNGALNGYVDAIAVSGDDVYVGGGFVNAAGIPEADFVARWDGAQWHAMGSNGSGVGAIGGVVRDIAVAGTDVYVAGDFVNAAGIAQADRVARWNGNNWFALGSGVGGTDGAIGDTVRTVAVSGSDVFVGGNFLNAAGIAQADRVARWNGSSWTALGSNGAGTDGALAGAVWRLAFHGTDLYAGGEFLNAGGIATADKVARWTGSAWAGLGSNGAGNGVLADPAYIVMSLAFIGNDVFVGGSFLNGAAISEADHVIRFDGSAWHALGSDGAGDGALDELGYAWEMAVMGDELVLAGSFQNVGSAEADRVIAWDGDSWKSLGSSAPGVAAIGAPANALAVAPAAIYAGGGFIDAGGEPTADSVAAYSLASPQPDGRIRKGKGALVGNDIYNITGDGQSREGKAPRGNTITFTISVQNDGGDADAFLVQAVGSTTTMYSVRYFRGTTEITSSLSPGSSYTTPTIAPGGKLAITVKVKVKSTATLGSNVLRVVNVHSLANSSILDSVMFTGMRK